MPQRDVGDSAVQVPHNVVILAAGQGTRMKSAYPKVLHQIAGRPLLAYVLANASRFGTPHVVIGRGADAVRQAFPDLQWIEQVEQKGTGHALITALPHLDPSRRTLVLYGDIPFLTANTLQQLTHTTAPLAILTTHMDNPSGYGRCLRDGTGRLTAIVEERDASAAVKLLNEINSGILVADTSHLARWLPQLAPHNAQGELYLTDLVAMAVADNVAVATCLAPSWEVVGINTHAQLAQAERDYQRRQADALLAAGVTLLDPARIDIRGQLHCGQDVIIDVGCVFEGEVVLEDNVRIAPNCWLKNSRVGVGSALLPYTMVDGAVIGAHCQLGPYARLRPGSQLEEGGRIGNFVEMKNSHLGRNSKANHLSYLGDATIGAHVNIGAGTITCNYDGANKHATHIGDGAFIGSGSQLVAPVKIGDHATIGAGTVLVKDAGADALTFTRVEQITKAGWQRPKKKNC